MYVCTEVALRGGPMDQASNCAWGRGHQKWVQFPNPVGAIGLLSCTLAHTCTLLCVFFSQLYSGQLRVPASSYIEEQCHTGPVQVYGINRSNLAEAFYLNTNLGLTKNLFKYQVYITFAVVHEKQKNNR